MLDNNNVWNEEKTSLPIRNYIESEAPQTSSKLTYYDNLKKLNTEKDFIGLRSQDEDYIPEDQIDLNKYNYLYNHSNDESSNNNFVDLEE